MRLPFAILCLASMLLGVATASPAYSQECVTIEMNRVAAAKIGIKDENIKVYDDIGFINEYIKSVGAKLPDDSAPAQLMIAEYPNAPGVWVGLVESGGCIRYSMKVFMAKHLYALSVAKPGV